MTIDELLEIWTNNEDEFLEFDRIPEEQRRSNRLDLCAFLLLDEKCSVNKDHDIVACSEHDEIYLQPRPEDCELTEDDMLTLIRCGVSIDADTGCFSMFT